MGKMKITDKRILMITRKIIVEDGIYHITQRAPGREIIFVEDKDYLRFLHLMKETAKNFKIDILCFALLPNHLHILLKIKDKNLDKAMKYLFQRYAQWFNKKYQRKGHVFCGVYRAALCQDNDYLIAISLYIHLNPLKAKLAKNVFSYKWFSLRVYLDPSKKSFINTEYILSIMGEKKRARKIYRDLVNDMARSKFKFENVIENKSAIENFTHTLAHYFKKNNNNPLRKNMPSFRSIFKEDSAIAKIRKARRRTGFDEKKAFAYCINQLKARGYSYKEIADRLNVNRVTIYRILHSNASFLFQTKTLH